MSWTFNKRLAGRIHNTAINGYSLNQVLKKITTAKNHSQKNPLWSLAYTNLLIEPNLCCMLRLWPWKCLVKNTSKIQTGTKLSQIHTRPFFALEITSYMLTIHSGSTSCLDPTLPSQEQVSPPPGRRRRWWQHRSVPDNHAPGHADTALPRENKPPHRSARPLHPRLRTATSALHIPISASPSHLFLHRSCFFYSFSQSSLQLPSGYRNTQKSGGWSGVVPSPFQ